MPKTSAFPRFRAKTYKLHSGEDATYYVWDGRGRKVPDVRLGTDRELALKLWERCEKGDFTMIRPRGTQLEKLPAVKQNGRRRRIAGPEWTLSPAWARTMYFNSERRAMALGKTFSLTPAQFLRLVAAADGRCSVTGIPFDAPGSRLPFAPSIDRIDSSKGYEDGNVRMVCLILNVSMSTWGMGPVLKLAEAVRAGLRQS